MRFISFSVVFTVLIFLNVFTSGFSEINMAQSSPMVIELNIEGGISKSYSETDIKQSLPIVSGWGGNVNRYGTPSNSTYWKGDNLPSMFNTFVGELDYNISIIASDGYNTTMTREEVDGGIRAFNEENITLAIKAIPVLAFEESNITIDVENGPLRLVFVGENNQSILTESFRWIRQVETIRLSIEDGITITLTTTTPKSTSSGFILVIIPTLILLIAYRRRK